MEPKEKTLCLPQLYSPPRSIPFTSSQPFRCAVARKSSPFLTAFPHLVSALVKISCKNPPPPSYSPSFGVIVVCVWSPTPSSPLFIRHILLKRSRIEFGRRHYRPTYTDLMEISLGKERKERRGVRLLNSFQCLVEMCLVRRVLHMS